MPAESQNKGAISFRGIPVSAGVCRGKILVLGRARPAIAKLQLTEEALAEEVNRLEKALVQTRHQILDIQRKVSERMGAEEGSTPSTPSPIVTPRPCRPSKMTICGSGLRTCAM